jgi:hypothetical protein
MDTNSATAQELKLVDDEIKVLERVTQELKRQHNALVPISRLPPETLVEIFSLLPFPAGDSECTPYLEWIYVTHVCRRWREIALHSPNLWTHINFTDLALAGITEILSRAKMSPLRMEANINFWKKERFNAFRRQLEAHISHIRYLTISGEFQNVLQRIVSPAPALVSLSLTTSSYPYESSKYVIPDSLFNGTAPELTRLELLGCSIRWKSPLLKGLQYLKIRTEYPQAIPTLEDWLAALNEMPQLKTLSLNNATPTISVDNPHISEPQRTVTLSSLTNFNITASARDCALALTHLVLPALISLVVTSESQSQDGDDVRLLIPHVARNAYGPQDTTPFQTILLNGDKRLIAIVAWAIPDADVGVCNWVTMFNAAASARLVFSVTSDNGFRDGMETVVLDSMLSLLPLNTISMLSTQKDTSLSKELWLSHAPKLTNLNRALLFSAAIKAFGEMLEEDASPNGLPRLPQLTTLILSNVELKAPVTHHLRDILVKRKERGVPLEVLDLRTCTGPEHAIKLLSETVGNVQGPTNTFWVRDLASFGWE